MQALNIPTPGSYVDEKRTIQTWSTIRWASCHVPVSSTCTGAVRHKARWESRTYRHLDGRAAGRAHGPCAAQRDQVGVRQPSLGGRAVQLGIHCLQHTPAALRAATCTPLGSGDPTQWDTGQQRSPPHAHRLLACAHCKAWQHKPHTMALRHKTLELQARRIGEQQFPKCQKHCKQGTAFTDITQHTPLDIMQRAV